MFLSWRVVCEVFTLMLLCLSFKNYTFRLLSQSLTDGTERKSIGEDMGN
jgi:hypothetical protein